MSRAKVMVVEAWQGHRGRRQQLRGFIGDWRGTHLFMTNLLSELHLLHTPQEPPATAKSARDTCKNLWTKKSYLKHTETSSLLNFHTHNSSKVTVSLPSRQWLNALQHVFFSPLSQCSSLIHVKRPYFCVMLCFFIIIIVRLGRERGLRCSIGRSIVKFYWSDFMTLLNEWKPKGYENLRYVQDKQHGTQKNAPAGGKPTLFWIQCKL